MKIKRTPLHTTANACFVTIFTALIAGTALDSSGLAAWADKLDNGILKSVAAPTAHAIDDILSPLGFGEHRDEVLTSIHKSETWLTTPIHQRLIKPKPTDSTTANKSASTTQTETIAPADKTQASSTTDVLSLEQILSDDYLTNLPAVPSDTPFSPALSELNKSPLTVALVGDSMMAVGLAPTLQQLYSNHHFIRAYKSGTGLSRPEVFNWMSEYPVMLKGQTPDLAIISIGANDAQDYEVNGQIVKFGTPKWLTIYGKRVDEFLNLVSSGQTHIIWLGMPHMKSGKFDTKIDTLNRLTYQLISRHPQMSWINTSVYIDDAGKFREYGTDDTGKNVRLRAGDGIHLANGGAMLIAKHLFDWQKTNTADTVQP